MGFYQQNFTLYMLENVLSILLDLKPRLKDTMWLKEKDLRELLIKDKNQLSNFLKNMTHGMIRKGKKIFQETKRILMTRAKNQMKF